MQRTHSWWWCCRSGEEVDKEALGSGDKVAAAPARDNRGGSLTWRDVDGGGATVWWRGRRVDELERTVRGSRFFFPCEHKRDGVAAARVKRWGELSQGKLVDRVRRSSVIGLPNGRNAWLEVGNRVGEGPGKNSGIPTGFLVPKGGLRV
jgi:hypothetical protein